MGKDVFRTQDVKALDWVGAQYGATESPVVKICLSNVMEGLKMDTYISFWFSNPQKMGLKWMKVAQSIGQLVWQEPVTKLYVGVG